MLSDSLHQATLPVVADGRPELAVPIPGPTDPWGVLLIIGEGPGALAARDVDVSKAIADGIATLVAVDGRAEEIAHLRHRADVMRRVASDIGSRLDLDRILSGLVDHAMVLFEGDGAAVFLRGTDGHLTSESARAFRASLGNIATFVPVPAGGDRGRRRPLFSVGYQDDPRAERIARIQEGWPPCAAPLIEGDKVMGLLNIYHDQPHAWAKPSWKPWRHSPSRPAWPSGPRRTTRGW
jgi:GAF domain-containing protein